MSELDRLFDVVRDGFREANDRLGSMDDHLRTLNSKVSKHETDIALLKQRPPEMRTRASDTVTMRDVKRAGAVILAVGGIVEGLHQASAFVLQALKGH